MSDDVIVEGSNRPAAPGTGPLPRNRPAWSTEQCGHRRPPHHACGRFSNLNKLRVGDPIILQTMQGTFHYAVGAMTVAPTDSAVFDSTAHSELTLTTCYSRHSATQRLVVALLRSAYATRALWAGGTTPPKTTNAERNAMSAGRRRRWRGSVADTVLWGLLTGGVGPGLGVLWRRVRGHGRWGVLTQGTPSSRSPSSCTSATSALSARPASDALFALSDRQRTGRPRSLRRSWVGGDGTKMIVAGCTERLRPVRLMPVSGASTRGRQRHFRFSSVPHRGRVQPAATLLSHESGPETTDVSAPRA